MHTCRLENVGSLERVIVHKMGNTHYNYTPMVSILKRDQDLSNVGRHFELFPHEIHNTIL
jgi:hypothetical protein